MSYLKLLEVPQTGKVTKISPDGKKLSVQTGPGQSLELDLEKDPNIDVSQSGNKTSIKLNHDNKNKLKKPGGAKIGAQVSIEEGDGNMEGYLATIDEYVEMLFKHKTDDLRYKAYNDEIAYRIQNAVDDIRTRELGLKPSLIRAKYNKQTESVKKKD